MDITKINYQELNQQAEDFLAANDSDGAMDQLNALKAELSKLPAETQVPDALVVCFTKFKLAALDMLPADQIKQVLTEHAALALNIPDFELKDKIESYLMAYPIWQRNTLKQGFLAALKVCKENFTSLELENSNGKKDLAPTVQNWLYLYEQAGGSGELNPLSRTQFIFHSGNGGKLKAPEQQKLVRLISFYEYLKQDAGRLENAADKFVLNFDGKMVVYDHGAFYEKDENGTAAPVQAETLKADAVEKITRQKEPEKTSQLKAMTAPQDENKRATSDLSAEQVSTRAEKPIQLKPEPWKNTQPSQNPKPLNIVFEKAKPILPQRPKFTVTAPQSKTFKPSFSQAQALIQEAAKERVVKPLPPPIVNTNKPQSVTPPPPVQLPRVNKNLVTDIKAPRLNAVMDLTDELSRMSLAEFRKLGASPLESAEKIKEKIELLAEESIMKKAEGILAWKKSPIQKLYFQLGQESMLRNMNIKEIISARSKQNQETLTEEEFAILADLNHQLRF